MSLFSKYYNSNMARYMSCSMFFGIASGFSLMISGNSLNFWIASEGIDLATIGLFSFVALPYSINFLWAPVFDSLLLPFLGVLFGRRISWLILMQALLALSVFALSRLNPSKQMSMFAALAFCISLFASAQDTILGAVRSEIMTQKQQAKVSGIYILGYRVGMLISGSLAIFLSSKYSWNFIYKLAAIFIVAISVSTFLFCVSLVKNDQAQILHKKKPSLSGVIFTNNIKKQLPVIIPFLISYRLPDNMINVMINPFLLHIGYDAVEISSFGKLFGVIAAIIGGFVASIIMGKARLINCLFYFGILHSAAHILLILQDIIGKNIIALVIIMGFESITGGMTMAAYIALITSICKGRARATQYAFFSAMMGLSRAGPPAAAGYLVEHVGWAWFFGICSALAIPSILLLRRLSILDDD